MLVRTGRRGLIGAAQEDQRHIPAFDAAAAWPGAAAWLGTIAIDAQLVGATAAS